MRVLCTIGPIATPFPGSHDNRRCRAGELTMRPRHLLSVANTVPSLETDLSPAQPASPLDSRLGLFPGSLFRLTTGRCTDCAAIPQALWYFAEETIAAPRPGLPVAGFARAIPPLEDLRRWASAHPADAVIDDPPLIWIGSPEILRHARLSSDGLTIEAGGQ